MRNFYRLLLLLSALAPAGAYAQLLLMPEIWVKSITLPGFPAFHSGVVAEHDGKWFMMGGRTNGMHGFYPPFAFPGNGRQDRIYVVDPDDGSVWSSGIDGLDTLVREQLSSSNMQFSEYNGRLYIVGGYGYHEAIDDFTTFPYLTSVNLDALRDSVIGGGDLNACFHTVIDSGMAVAGGRLGRVDDRFFLACGHYFHHRYSSADLGDFIQRYTYQVRMFDILDSAGSLSAENKTTVTDSVLFRRRDFSMTAYSEGGGKGLIVWSGVFRDSVDLPHYKPIRIHADGTYETIPLDQKMAHYQTGAMSLKGTNGQSFPPGSQNLHFFFGGMAEYYLDSLSNVVQDSLVPFVKTFSSVHLGSAAPQENYFGILPVAYDYGGMDPDHIRYAFEGFEGTNMEFIPNRQYLAAGVEVLEIDPYAGTPVKLGYLVGGIESTGRNIADMNDPSLSFASGKIYEVYYRSTMTGGIDENTAHAVRVYPNPATDRINVQVDGPVQRWEVVDVAGKALVAGTGAGNQSLDVSALKTGAYFLKVFTTDRVYHATFIKQ